MWYILTNSILAALVLFDATKREVKSPPMWGLSTFLLGPFSLALYLSYRPLMADEVRSGGMFWSYARNFVLIWTLLVFLLAVSQLFHLNEGDEIMQMALHWSGLSLTTDAGLLMHLRFWLFPIAAVVAGGLIFRRRVIEIGPTGPLAWSNPTREEAPTGTFIIGAPTR